ncbi:immunity protein Imm33 domain-containing protein [Caulobacter soli]|uniref:immunity protein Imm33 domain-containing protein n=1 Tax=Caulobacter soli TaxID=2708539 RepID=UPI0013EB4E5D|nr:DUF2185 domain-containing protein [Caulobacter soli]
MRILLDRFYDLHRRLWGRYSLDDPRPIALAAPYTFPLPSEAEGQALTPGELVKLMFRSDPPGRKWDAERMWVKVTEVSPDGLVGVLDNDPYDMPQLRAGARIAFQAHHVIDIEWGDAAKGAMFVAPQRQIWDRCMVDRCVIEEGVAVSYVYRETPDLDQEDDKFPDSGWRVRGDWRGLTDDEIDAREVDYVAIGVVLNKDDSWLHLLHEPVGSAFIRDFETDLFVREEDRPEG